MATATQYNRTQVVAGRTDKWIPQLPEETKVVFQDLGDYGEPIQEKKTERDAAEEEVTAVGGTNPSVLDCVGGAVGARPFSPPFAAVSGAALVSAVATKNETRKCGSPRFDDSLDAKGEKKDQGDDKVNVIYDHILKCYYEPKSNTYYQLNQ